MRIISLHNGHDASITAFEEGKILGHWELERVLNIKHFCGVDNGNEIAGVLYDHVLPRLGWEVRDIDKVVFAGKSEWAKTEFAEYVPQYENDNMETPYAWGHVKLRGEHIRDACAVLHHVNHMAYAYYTSPFTRATLFSYDGIGDDTSTMAGYGEGNKLEVRYIFSKNAFGALGNNGIGLCYSYLGRLFPFLGNDLLATAGKAMGLSSYGKPYSGDEHCTKSAYHPKVYDICWDMITEWMPNPGKYKAALEEELGPVDWNDPMDYEVQNVMATIQACLEDYLCDTVMNLCLEFKCRDVAMAGGCALNVQANSELYHRRVVDNLYVPPATSDCGVSIGAGLYVWHNYLDGPFNGVEWHNPYLGDEVYGKPPRWEASLTRNYRDEDKVRDDYIKEMREKYPELVVQPMANKLAAIKFAATQLADKKIIAWAQGKAEIGPRALGNRSILCHPGPLQEYAGDNRWMLDWRMGGGSMKKVINEAVKHREYWRPFAPLALWPDCQEYFEIDHEQPYMLEAPLAKDWDMSDFDSHARKWWDIAAVVHVDGTTRVQTVHYGTNHMMTDLLIEFKALTGLPVLLNTSLNDAGIPINNTMEDILNLVRDTEVDFAIVDNWVFRKRD